MLNKQNLWYITLFSLIVVLCVYYIAMPQNTSLLDVTNEIKEEPEVIATISPSTEILALRVEADEEMLNKMNELQSILTSETTSVEEKNNAYEQLVSLNSNKGIEENLENILLKDFGYNSFVKISGDSISVVIDNKEHSNVIANNVIRRIQSEFESKKDITVKFQ